MKIFYITGDYAHGMYWIMSSDNRDELCGLAQSTSDEIKWGYDEDDDDFATGRGPFAIRLIADGSSPEFIMLCEHLVAQSEGSDHEAYIVR